METYAQWALDAHARLSRLGDDCRGEPEYLGREKLVALATEGLKLAAYLEGTEAFKALEREDGR